MAQIRNLKQKGSMEWPTLSTGSTVIWALAFVPAEQVSAIAAPPERIASSFKLAAAPAAEKGVE